MTTIVYDHERRQIACDSRISKESGTIGSDNYKKYKTVDGFIFFFTGKPCDADLLVDYFLGKQTQELIPQCEAIIVDVEKKKAFYFCVNNELIGEKMELSFCECIGSGAQFAFAALDFGKTAKETVEYAMTRDCYTGGKVHVYDIETARFI